MIVQIKLHPTDKLHIAKESLNLNVLTSFEESVRPNTKEDPFKPMKPSLLNDHLCLWQGLAGFVSWVLETCRLQETQNQLGAVNKGGEDPIIYNQ